jgi:hypothetical protein
VKRFAWIFGAAALALAGFTSNARAEDRELSKDWTLRAGFFIPEREAPRSQEGDLWFTIGAEKSIYKAERWDGTFSVDYYGSGKIYNIPITVNARGETNRLRYGIGAGVGISHDLSQGKTGFSWNALLGYTLIQGANPVTADVRYQFLSTGSGALNGFQFTVGYHY